MRRLRKKINKTGQQRCLLNVQLQFIPHFWGSNKECSVPYKFQPGFGQQTWEFSWVSRGAEAQRATLGMAIEGLKANKNFKMST